MTASEHTIHDVQHSIRHAVHHHSNMVLAQGVIMTVLGMLAIIWPQISTVAADVYIGAIFLLAGFAGLAVMFLAPTVSVFLWSLLTAALSLLAGVLLLWHPVAGAVSLTLVLIAFFIVEGVFQTIVALSYRSVLPKSWGWMVFSGITDLILAGLIIAGWPSSARWALGLIVGVNLITSGVAILMVAVTAKRVINAAEKVFG